MEDELHHFYQPQRPVFSGTREVVRRSHRPSPLACLGACVFGCVVGFGAKYLAAAFLILWLLLGGQ